MRPKTFCALSMSVQAGNNVLSPFNKNRLFEDLPTYYRTKQYSKIKKDLQFFFGYFIYTYHFKNATLINIHTKTSNYFT